MRTLALLAALLLLALHGWAEPLEEAADQVMELEDQLPTQAQAGAQDQDMAVSFDGDGAFARAAAGSTKKIYCHCRARQCKSREVVSGSCGFRGGRRFLFCCK